VLLASNLHQNEALLPHYILQLLELLVGIPQGSAHVSIYESGSTDKTGGVMHTSPASQDTTCNP
jgi:alpha-1,3-mannosyltransferase